jgi:long-chain acyl-CoA synthetase
MDIINTLSRVQNQDNKHRLYFTRGDHEITSITLAELDRRVMRVAARLHRLGIGKGDRVGVISRNCVEWVLIDIAVLKLGGVVAGFDSGRFDPTSILERFGIKLLFVQGAEDSGPVISTATVWEWACTEECESFVPRHEGYKADEPFAIKFTSGSTGPPKGMEALAGGLNDSLTVVQEMFEHGDNDNILVFLRLAQLQQRYWVYSGLAFGHDVTITNLDFVLPMAQACHPTVVMGVPGFFEDLKRGLEATFGATLTDPLKRRDCIQAALGGRIRYLWTGSAPAGMDTLEFYDGCGVPIYQGYGLNETCIISKNCPGANRLGSVGKILRCKTVRFDTNGVLVVKSRNPIITGYLWCSPGDNEKLFLASGEILTGDIAHLDEDGFLYIDGRIDDLIVLNTGRNVMVAPVEKRVKTHSAVHDCVLYGHGRPFVTALISPASDLVDRAGIDAHIREINRSLFPEQQIRGVVISPEPFSLENGLLTSQFKPLRKKIHARFAAEIDAVYENAGREALWTGAYGQ